MHVLHKGHSVPLCGEDLIPLLVKKRCLCMAIVIDM